MKNKIDTEKIVKQFEKVNKVREQLDSESDRGCCLMAVSFIENEIEILISQKLVGSEKFIKNLFEFNGPLGTFSSKIKMAFALGFISKSTMDNLELIRKVRNDFGHTYEPINFDTENIRQRIMQLKGHFYDVAEINEISARAIFTNTVSSILSLIHTSEILMEKFTEKETEKVFDKEFQKSTREEAKRLMPENDHQKVLKNMVEKTTQIIKKAQGEK
ncbi:MAG: MltR family transcriptional regulator [Flavobacterium sp.]